MSFEIVLSSLLTLALMAMAYVCHRLFAAAGDDVSLPSRVRRTMDRAYNEASQVDCVTVQLAEIDEIWVGVSIARCVWRV